MERGTEVQCLWMVTCRDGHPVPARHHAGQLVTPVHPAEIPRWDYSCRDGKPEH